MTSTDNSHTPALRDNDPLHADKYGTKLVDAAQKLQDKHGAGDAEKHGPAGGFDATPFPKAPPGYTVKITFHSAKNLPFADLSLTSDPYIIATLRTDLEKRHKQDPDIKLRTPTIHRNTNPSWEAQWTLAHVPASGFYLKLRLYDEDPTDHDDRLGNVHVPINGLDRNWKNIDKQSYPVKKRMGSKRAYTLRGCMALVSRSVSMDGEVIISIENLGKSEGEGGRPYTISPLPWSQHFSPLIGRLIGIKDTPDSKDGKRTNKYNFQAIQMQLRGPVPEPLYHRYVEFKPFVAGMFTSHTLRGRILNHALHHQHARIYNYDTSTKYGSYDKPCTDMTSRLLEFAHYDQGGRIFTYVLTLDGQLRFTETGKEFGIDMLSKHTMHSDVSIYIAFSGEFFIRRLKRPYKERGSTPDPETEVMPPASASPEEKGDQLDEHVQKRNFGLDAHSQSRPQPNHDVSGSHTSNAPSAGKENGRKLSLNFFHGRKTSHANSEIGPHEAPTHEHEDPEKDPSHYELIIDNDSGTYRPNAKYLSSLKHFLADNFPGLKVVTLDCQKDEEKMKKLKKEQADRKKNSGKQMMYMQNSSVDSFSSSDEEELRRRASGGDGGGAKGKVRKAQRKVKNMVKGDGSSDSDEDEKQAPTTGAEASDKIEEQDNEDEFDEKTGQSSFSKEGAQHAKSDDQHLDEDKKRTQKQNSVSDHQSFDTAYTDPIRNDHFVTPQPSFADGGLRQINADETTSKSQDKNNISSLSNGTVHHAVTSAP